ncbi:ImmA/IrrE family metallo-endopeptidase [Ilumatobacter sp.]|uniref:ImmA/IrrE family metallo-endopeptidase n=1 Tax=Ilumatobacter sp. TaxID=1967498 RepID=UPI003B52967E
MSFNPTRLSLARHSVGWTKTKLAQEVGITSRRLADYENRGDTPPTETLQLLADKLGVTTDFFSIPETAAPSNVSFRSLRSMPARVRDMALAAASMTVDVGNWIGERFDMEPVALPDDLAGSDPTIAAGVLREQWGLGLQPAPNLIQLAELMGVRVFALAVTDRTLDAFSFWDDAIPYVLLNARGTAERRRWDVAHEIGHLLLHAGAHHLPSDRGREDEADLFAAALLLPPEGLRKNPVYGRSLADVREHKVWWKVSAVALIRQMYRLGQLTEWEYRNLAIEASKAKLRRIEDDIAAETSPTLTQVLEAMRTRGLGPSSIASELHLRKSDVRNMFHSLAPVQVGDNGEAATTAPRSGHLRVV